MDISIVVITYNYSQYLKRCLYSCLEQLTSSLSYEVIVIDDGSTDDTREVLCSFSDSRLHTYTIKNSGIEAASNQGFELANGRFIVRVDADDRLSPNYLVTMAPLLEENFGFYYSDYEIIDEHDELKETVHLPSFNNKEILSRGDFLATGTIYPSSVLRTVGGYNTSTKNCGLENYELIVKLIKMGFYGKHVPIPLFQYRQHGENMSKIRKNRIVAYGQKMFELNQLGTYCTNKYHPYKLTLNPET